MPPTKPPPSTHHLKFTAFSHCCSGSIIDQQRTFQANFYSLSLGQFSTREHHLEKMAELAKSCTIDISYPKFLWLQYCLIVQLVLGIITTTLAVVTLLTLKQKPEYENALVLYDSALIAASLFGFYSLRSKK